MHSVSDILQTKCFIAQPVQLQQNLKMAMTVIRVAIGAPLVCWAFDKIQKLSSNDPQAVEKVIAMVERSDFVLLSKMRLILENWSAFANHKQK